MTVNSKTTEEIKQAVEYAGEGGSVDDAMSFGQNIMSQLGWAVEARSILPPYYSRKRDIALRKFWKQHGSSHISSAMYNAQAKLLSIPCHVVARDPSIVRHVDMASQYDKRLKTLSEFGAGLYAALEKWYEDYLSQDNGAFLEILGPGDKSGPIEGPAVGVRHLDSAKCVRTKDPIYPVRYEAEDGKQYALHFSRVIAKSQMPSSDSNLNGVGYCAVSRSVDVAQNLIDIMLHKQERLGSRPMNKLFLGQGIKGEDIMRAFRAAELQMDSSGLRRFGRNVAMGSDNTDIDVKVLDLTSMDQFKEEISIPLDMFAIALAFGMDANELWPGASGSSGASAALSHLRARGRLPRQVTDVLEREFNFKFLPPELMLVFDFQDDEEDQQQAIIRDIRARNRERNRYAGITDVHAERRLMLQDGDLTRELFIEMELNDGRLEDGMPSESMFFSRDQFFSGPNGILNLGVPNPLLVSENDAEDMIKRIELAYSQCMMLLGTETAASKRRKIRIGLSALKALRKHYATPVGDEPEDDVQSVDNVEGTDGVTEDQSADDQEGELGPRFRQRGSQRRKEKLQKDSYEDYLDKLVDMRKELWLQRLSSR